MPAPMYHDIPRTVGALVGLLTEDGRTGEGVEQLPTATVP